MKIARTILLVNIIIVREKKFDASTSYGKREFNWTTDERKLLLYVTLEKSLINCF